MPTGYVGILSFELHFPESHSLKEKRMHLRSVKQQLSNRTGCSIAEVDHHDTWQRAGLTLACVTREAGEADEAARRGGALAARASRSSSDAASGRSSTRRLHDHARSACAVGWTRQ